MTEKFKCDCIAVYSGDEGTNHCRLEALEAQVKDLLRAHQALANMVYDIVAYPEEYHAMDNQRPASRP